MRWASHILVIFAVLLCALHLEAPALAHAVPAGHAAEHAAGEPADDGESHSGTEQFAHASHHHCPIAPDDDRALVLGAVPSAGALVFARPALALHSLAQAPPTQPPTA